MNKEEFLSALDRRLQLINEKERRDIIDEYRSHIEMKVADGKSEEEAIADFGNIDELVDDILDAYKINTDRANQSFDRKFNVFMDDLFEGFKRFLGSFTSLEVDDVVKLIFEVIIILLMLAIVHIPFSIVGSLGSSLLRNLIGFGIGFTLAGIWKVIIELAYVVVFIVVIVNVVLKRVNRYRDANGYHSYSSVFDDFKDTFHFDTAKNRTYGPYAASGSEKQERTRQEENVYADVEATIHDVEDETENAESEFRDYRAEKNKERKERYYQERRYSSDVEGSVTSVFRILMRIFYCLLLIPFLCIIIVLSIALGSMVVLSIQGFTLVGAYLLAIGGLFVTGAFLSLLHNVLWRKG